ncbi:DUF572-domain-containing protein [Saitoella complicata NRRL Y-17804]|uniref:DUF572-domain-containing protein n=1 Tax=Saitoella complicata (strain BCRC 22490 / CBS 7301 / JCM 7358 / NBRC 10748 / NRRL Y-17804) TaxID=698492 RepID=A0A0E9NAX0_SAICN|nr:DUF572-domain-containing protein [Saitoella complicata NRRL Y-17804]ODQ53849.1 DUF572-domain-containing protein [Saitoella complicata NRRL Y-17804]GAO46943.1 hypothetical protein G7K_1160-t1 [Saitoella complicata NRRL Y-17804]
MQGFGYGKYYPPDFDPKKHKTLNGYAGTHALGDRARKLDKGILIVRFELPFHVWCTNCDTLIAQGVRFNAEKKKAGAYYTTPIWSFRMKTACCQSWLEIHTNPKETTYDVILGGKKKAEEWDAAEAGVIKIKDAAEAERLASDPFARIEKESEDVRKGKEAAPRIADLANESERQWADPYTQSRRMRNVFRTDKKVLRAKAAEAEEIQKRNSLSIKLLDESPMDARRAALVEFGALQATDEASKKRNVLAGAMFPRAKRKATAPATTRERLQQEVVANARLSKDPFVNKAGVLEDEKTTLPAGVMVGKGKNKESSLRSENSSERSSPCLVAYGSDDEEG